MEVLINHIEEDRKKTRKYFVENNYINDSAEVIVSPNKKLRIIKKEYRQNREDLNWVASKIEIYDENNNLQKTVITDNQEFFYEFIEVDNIEYFIFAEVLCGGNSVINLNSYELFGFSDGTDGFTCSEYYVSPDKQRLASFGCFWAGPYFIKIFDITKIECLPWPCIQEIYLKEDGEMQIKWTSERKIQLKEYKANKVIQDQEYEVK